MTSSNTAFDLEAWYEATAPNCQRDPHPTQTLMEVLGKKMFHSRCFYPKGHDKQKKANGANDASKGQWATTSKKWRDYLTAHNEKGRRVYFVVNDGGNTWDEVAARNNACHNHYCEWDKDHGFSAADALNSENTGITNGVEFLLPSASVFSGSWSPHTYFALSESYEDPIRWYVNQCRLSQLLGTDSSCVDLSRVMRLPGFRNTIADGSQGREALLLFAHKDRRHSIAEFEDALHKAELRHKLDTFNAIPIGAMNNRDRRPLIVKAVSEIFDADEAKKLEEFFPYAAKRKSQKGSITDYMDSRSREELENSFAMIPPFVPDNGTFQGKEPVYLSDGTTKVHIHYFRMLAGLKAAWLQRRLPEEELIELICEKWQDVNAGWVNSTISGANGSINSNSYWHFARLCGYQLSERSGTAYDNAPAADEVKASSIQLSTEERTKEIEAKFQQLYEVKGAYADTFAQQEALTKELYDLGVGRETISRRLLVMLGQEFGFDNNADTTARQALPATTTTAPVEDLIPGLVMKGRVAVVAGTYGSWKTTAAALIGDKVVTGGMLPLMAGPIKDKGRVLFIASDGGEGAISTVKKYAARCGAPLERHGDKFQFFGANRDLNQVSWSFCFRDLRRLVEHLKEYADDPMPVRLVIIDSFHAVMDLAGMDSGIGPMNEAMRLLGDIAAKNGVSILLLHHTLKSNDGVIAGHAAIPQIADSVHFLTKEDRLWKDQRVREWKVDKHRGGEERTVEFIIENDTGILVAPKDTSEAVQNLLLGEMFFEVEDGSSPRNLCNYLAEYNLKETRVKKELASMRRNGLVKTSNNRWFLERKGYDRARKANEAQINAEKLCGIKTKTTAEDAEVGRIDTGKESIAQKNAPISINHDVRRAINREKQQAMVDEVEEVIAAEEEANTPSADETNAYLAACTEAWDKEGPLDFIDEYRPADAADEKLVAAFGLNGVGKGTQP